MPTVIARMSISLDGFVTGPDDDLEQLHEWSYPRSGTVSEANRAVLEEVFVTDGVVSAVKQAHAAAGDGTVTIIGGANVFRQALNAGLVDELHLAHVPVVLGAGIRLFDQVTAPAEFELTRVVPAPEVTHVTYRVLGTPLSREAAGSSVSQAQ